MFELSIARKLLQLSCVIVSLLLLNGCVSSQHTNSRGVRFSAVTPANFDCGRAPRIDLQLQIQQDSDDNPTIVDCVAGACTGANTPGLGKNQWVEWTLSSGSTTDTFYIIFTDDKGPSGPGRNRTAAISASENGRLCMKINSAANQGVYNYSTYVKHCAQNDPLCRPEVLDPILYVR